MNRFGEIKMYEKWGASEVVFSGEKVGRGFNMGRKTETGSLSLGSE